MHFRNNIKSINEKENKGKLVRNKKNELKKDKEKNNHKIKESCKERKKERKMNIQMRAYILMTKMERWNIMKKNESKTLTRYFGKIRKEEILRGKYRKMRRKNNNYEKIKKE